VAGFAVPGMKVDVLISGRPPGSNSFDGGTQTKTILQNIEVLSAGQNFQKDAEGKPVTVQVINLVATPQQAEILSLASNDAKIQLVLRNPLDKEETNTPGTALASLFSGRPVPALAPARPAVRRAAPPPPKVEPPPPPKPQMKVVEVIHGMKNGVTKAEAKFEKPSEVLP
jgi:pilus assembly protein CpaB